MKEDKIGRNYNYFLPFLFLILNACSSFNSINEKIRFDIKFTKNNTNDKFIYFSYSIKDTPDFGEIKELLKKDENIYLQKFYFFRYQCDEAFLEILKIAKNRNYIIQKQEHSFINYNKWTEIEIPKCINITELKSQKDKQNIKISDNIIIDEVDNKIINLIDRLKFAKPWIDFTLYDKNIIFNRKGENAKTICVNFTLQDIIATARDKFNLQKKIKFEYLQNALITNLNFESFVENGVYAFINPGSSNNGFLEYLAEIIKNKILIIVYDNNSLETDILETIFHEGFHLFYQKSNFFDDNCSLLRYKISTFYDYNLIKEQIKGLIIILQKILENGHKSNIFKSLKYYISIREQNNIQENTRCRKFWETIEGSAEYVGIKNIENDFKRAIEICKNNLENIGKEIPKETFFIFEGCAHFLILEYLSKYGFENNWQQEIFKEDDLKYSYDIIHNIVKGAINEKISM